MTHLLSTDRIDWYPLDPQIKETVPLIKADIQWEYVIEIECLTLEAHHSRLDLMQILYRPHQLIIDPVHLHALLSLYNL